MVLSRLIVLINGRLMAVGRDIAGDHRRPHHLSSARFWWRLDGYGARYARKPLRVGYAADAMVFSVFPVYYGLELPRVISVNMARRIPTLFWYVSPKSPPQYQKKKSVQTFGGAYLPAYTVLLPNSTPTDGRIAAGRRRASRARSIIASTHCTSSTPINYQYQL